MAIFGFGFRSKKKKQTTSLPQPPKTPIYSSPLPLEGPYASHFQQNWSYIEQRPSISHGYGVPPPQQGWEQGWEQGWTNQPIHITQNNYIIAPPLPDRPQKTKNGISKFSYASVSNLLAGDVPDCVPGSQIFNQGAPAGLNQGAALCDLISSKFNTVITLIDGERFSGDEGELAVFQPPEPMWQQEQSQNTDRSLMKGGKSKGMVNNPITSKLVSTNYFAKVHLYANSRLPPDFPPLKIYLSTFPLLCLAAQYSERVYNKPGGQEKETHVDADWRLGTKAMVIKSVPMDDMNTIVFAVRGSQTFMDWAVNLKSAPTAPEGFLDDPGNLCHAGFLTVAKKMIKPVAARLRHLLQENPGRSKYSLLITGHSAGGAVAALLYSHMLSNTPEAQSELNILTGCFKRIHCVSFGAPPVTLLPLTRSTNPALRKSLFFSFINEGDPVARADKAYVRSLLDLYSSPAPGQLNLEDLTSPKPNLRKSTSSITLNKMRPTPKKSASTPVHTIPPIWPVPEAALSNAGRLVLLRSVERYQPGGEKKKRTVQDRMNEGVIAQTISDDLLRGVVWGDPVCHMMRLYARRIEILATNAVMGKS